MALKDFFVAIQVQNTGITDAIGAVFFGVGLFEIILCLLLIIAFIIYFNDPNIRRSAPRITMLILLGVLFLATSEMLYSIGKSDAICTISSLLYHAGMSILLTGLCVKNFRIYRIFSNKQATAINISENRLILVMVVLTGVYMLAIIVPFCIFGFKALVIQSTQSIYYRYVNCQFDNEIMNAVFQFYTQIFICILILINLILAWLTRKVKADFRETNPLVAISIIILATYVIFIPLGLTFTQQVNSETLKFVINEELLTIIAVSALVILFIPKIIKIRRNSRRGNRLSGRLSDDLSNE